MSDVSIRPGIRVVVQHDNGNREWLYVIAPLHDGRVFGVRLGGTASTPNGYATVAVPDDTVTATLTDGHGVPELADFFAQDGRVPFPFNPTAADDGHTHYRGGGGVRTIGCVVSAGPTFTGGRRLYVLAVTGDTLHGVTVDDEPGHVSSWTSTDYSVNVSHPLGYEFGRDPAHRWEEQVIAFFTGPAAQAEERQLFTREELAAAVNRARDEVSAEAARAFEEWKERATEVAHEYADNNDLCSEFDRCMEEIGLPTRRVEYDVTYRVVLERGTDPHGLDAEDLFRDALEGAGSPHYVERV